MSYRFFCCSQGNDVVTRQERPSSPQHSSTPEKKNSIKIKVDIIPYKTTLFVKKLPKKEPPVKNKFVKQQFSDYLYSCPITPSTCLKVRSKADLDDLLRLVKLKIPHAKVIKQVFITSRRTSSDTEGRAIMKNEKLISVDAKYGVRLIALCLEKRWCCKKEARTAKFALEKALKKALKKALEKAKAETTNHKRRRRASTAITPYLKGTPSEQAGTMNRRAYSF